MDAVTLQANQRAYLAHPGDVPCAATRAAEAAAILAARPLEGAAVPAVWEALPLHTTSKTVRHEPGRRERNEATTWKTNTWPGVRYCFRVVVETVGMGDVPSLESWSLPSSGGQ